MEYRLQFGTLIVGHFTGRRRMDVYVSDVSGQRYYEPAFATGPSDKSNRHDCSIGYGYDARCSCCYLGFTHTEEAHKQRIGG